MSKHDYNFQLLLAIAVAGCIILGIGAIGALLMFLTAFM
jgi:uncharacterized membrane protein